MSLIGWRRERFIKKTLRKLANQRVVQILQPGNVWVIEKALSDDEKTESDLRTCHMRGWVEVLDHAVPTEKLTKDGKLPEDFIHFKPMYRLTEAGWSVIHRTHVWVIVTCIVALATLVATILSIMLTSSLKP